MTETTIVALVVIIGIFVIITITLFKFGIDGAIKMWSATGIIFGAIVSFYFTDQVNQKQITKLQNNYKIVKTALNTAVIKAKKANKLVSPISAALEGKRVNWAVMSTGNFISSMSKSDRKELAIRFSDAENNLNEIEVLNVIADNDIESDNKM